LAKFSKEYAQHLYIFNRILNVFGWKCINLLKINCMLTEKQDGSHEPECIHVLGLPVVPHKAVAKVSKIGNLQERLVVVNHGWQSQSTDGPKGA
jgi:hypothetical protein